MAYIKRRGKRISNLNVDGHRPLGMGGVEKRKNQKTHTCTYSHTDVYTYTQKTGYYWLSSKDWVEYCMWK